MFDRFGALARVMWSALRGKSFCWLNAADRARSANALDDASFLKWGRWATGIVEHAWMHEADKKGRDFDEVLVTHSVVGLARMVLRSGQTRLIGTVNGVTYAGKELGDWRVIIERAEKESDKPAQLLAIPAIDFDALESWLFNLNLELLSKPDVEVVVGGSVLSIQSLFNLLSALDHQIMPDEGTAARETYLLDRADAWPGSLDGRDMLAVHNTAELIGALKEEVLKVSQTLRYRNCQIKSLHQVQAERDAEIERLRNLLKPQWFYLEGYSSEECHFSPEEAIATLDLTEGHHAVQIDCAGPMPSLHYHVHVRTKGEMDALETDDREVLTVCASEQEAQSICDKLNGGGE